MSEFEEMVDKWCYDNSRIFDTSTGDVSAIKTEYVKELFKKLEIAAKSVFDSEK